ncbi:MAG: hypothetical protein HYZ63_03080 [Candidatus Andersenbacteria bacterium]|nr:hypothetical protein [Candidatus Andersenbacteria bacterium]
MKNEPLRLPLITSQIGLVMKRQARGYEKRRIFTNGWLNHIRDNQPELYRIICEQIGSWSSEEDLIQKSFPYAFTYALVHAQAKVDEIRRHRE